MNLKFKYDADSDFIKMFFTYIVLSTFQYIIILTPENSVRCEDDSATVTGILSSIVRECFSVFHMQPEPFPISCHRTAALFAPHVLLTFIVDLLCIF